MEPRISLITLGVDDLERSYRFYRDGLGLPTTWAPKHGVVFFKTAGTVFGLYPREKLAEDIGEGYNIPATKCAGITLAHNVKERDDVDRLLREAEKAGGTIVKSGQDAFWGGYSGYFADPDGYLWEVAYGAFPFDEQGHLILSDPPEN